MRFVKIISREYSVQYTEMSLRSLRSEAKKHLPAFVLNQFYVPENGNESCYMESGEWQRFVKALSKKYANKKSLRKFIKLFHRYGKNYVSVAKRAGRAKFAEKNNKTIVEYYVAYQKSLLDYSAYVWMGFLLNNIYSEKAKKTLDNKNPIKDKRISAALFSPSKKTGILRLQDRIGKFKKEGRTFSQAEVKKIIEDYAWLSCLDIHNDPWGKGDVTQFVRSMKIVPAGYSFEKAAVLANLGKKEKDFFKLVKELAYVKDMRDEYRRKGIYSIQPFFSEIAKRLGLGLKELAYFSSQEVLHGLNRTLKLSKAEAANRRNGFLIYYSKGICVTADKSAIENFIVGKIKNEISGKEIKGIPASGGKARGIAKIIYGVKDLAKVNEGDIMVAVTTHPDFVPAMHKAAAIITNEGGITSHAAIVSRELKIPCIVGTKNATIILRDGNLVEVDAENGIVKIIKQ